MELDPGLVCYCGKAFALPSGLTNHQHHCNKSKRRLEGVLSKAKNLWYQKKEEQRRKRQRVESASAAPPPPPQATASTSSRGVEGHGGDVHLEHHTSLIVLDHYEDPSQESETAEAQGLHLSIAERRPRREIQLPECYRDILPQAPAALPPTNLSTTTTTSTPAQALPEPILPPPVDGGAHNSTLNSRKILRSPLNVFHLFRQYFAASFPSHDPEAEITQEDLSDIAPSSVSVSLSAATSSCQDHAVDEKYGPYPNHSSFMMGHWYWNSGAQKSQANFKELVSIISDPSFKPEDIRDTPWDQVNKLLGGGSEEEDSWVEEFSDAGWCKDSVEMLVPFHRFTTSPGPKLLGTGNLYHRSIVSIIRERLAMADSIHFHFEPYELYWQPVETSPPMRVYGELYTSPAFLEMHNQLQDSPPEPGCNLPRVVVGLMLASDETHLTSYGNAHLWPAYLYFGNDSKYRRCKPSCHLCNHVAYFEKLPDHWEDFYVSHTGKKGPGEKVSSFCRREYTHAQWKIILDDEFLEAYEHGIIVACIDGLERRFYPRIVTYSADYKEKVAISCVRHFGKFPCPRCLISKSSLRLMGTPGDRKIRKTTARVNDACYREKVRVTRKDIFEKNYDVESAQVEKLLKDTSIVPCESAFSERLSAFGLNPFEMMVNDLMHEVEGGSWPTVFTHLLRILESIGEHLIHELNRRFRDVPSFGRDTIRRFMNNIADMRQLAARDWEDMLQCAIPVFDSLLPEPHNKTVLDLLFVSAHWHGLAKMRLHTEPTLELLDIVTINLGARMREFQIKTCPAFKTRELQKEAEARNRKEMAKAKAKAKGVEEGEGDSGKAKPTGEAGISTRGGARSTRGGARSTRGGARSTRGRGPSTQLLQASNPAVLQTAVPPTMQTAVPHASLTSNPSAVLPASSNSADNLASGIPISPSVASVQMSPAAGTSASHVTPASKPAAPKPAPSTRKPIDFSLTTYKYHALGDYVATIRKYGTTDSYSTEPGELEHRTPKSRYKRTSKKHYIKQLTQIDHWEARICRIRELRSNASQESGPVPDEKATSPQSQYHIGISQNQPEHILQFLQKNAGDPAIKNFLPRLKMHLLPRVQQLIQSEAAATSGRENSALRPALNDAAAPCVFFQRDRMYAHKIVRFNYTTYDVRRAQDLVNPTTSHCNIMLLASPSASPSSPPSNVRPYQPQDADLDSNTSTHQADHPFLYARVLGIFHVNVVYTGPEALDYNPRRLDFLWVRWYESSPFPGTNRLDRLSFPPLASEGAFGFVDPAHVLRSCHIIPAFSQGKWHPDGRGLSKWARDHEDWKSYYINRFVDRDMLMRYHWGMGIGHTYCYESPFMPKFPPEAPSNSTLMQDGTIDDSPAHLPVSSEHQSRTSEKYSQAERQAGGGNYEDRDNGDRDGDDGDGDGDDGDRDRDGDDEDGDGDRDEDQDDGDDESDRENNLLSRGTYDDESDDEVFAMYEMPEE